MQNITSLDELKAFNTQHFLAVIVFYTNACVVCKPLKKKINDLLKDDESVGVANINIEEVAEVRGEYSIFTAPITLLFVDGIEAKRYSAGINLSGLKETINRYREMKE